MFREGTVSFEKTVRVELQQDAHLIVVAIGEGSDLEQGWGLNPYGEMHPVAYTESYLRGCGPRRIRGQRGHPRTSADDLAAR